MCFIFVPSMLIPWLASVCLYIGNLFLKMHYKLKNISLTRCVVPRCKNYPDFSFHQYCNYHHELRKEFCAKYHLVKNIGTDKYADVHPYFIVKMERDARRAYCEKFNIKSDYSHKVWDLVLRDAELYYGKCYYNHMPYDIYDFSDQYLNYCQEYPNTCDLPDPASWIEFESDSDPECDSSYRIEDEYQMERVTYQLEAENNWDANNFTNIAESTENWDEPANTFSNIVQTTSNVLELIV